jgi:hypothetical protein
MPENSIGRTHSSDKLPRFWMRGTKVGFRDVTPTIPSEKQIHVVGLKNFIQSSKEKKSAINGNFVQGFDQGLSHMKRFKDG